MYLHDDVVAFRDLNRATAEHLGIRQAFVYKDYYTCMILKEVTAANPAFVFKGGTALSKCYRAISRFSEDIDLGLDDARPTEAARKNTKKAVQFATKKLGLEIGNIDETRSRREFNQYRTSLPKVIPDVLDDDMIIVETGLMTPASPSILGKAMSFIGEYLLSIGAEDILSLYGLERFSLKVVSVERAFADKAFALADYYLNGDIPKRQSRHIYDLYKLEQALTLDAKMNDLFKRVRSERRGNLKCSSAAQGVSLAGVLQEIYDKQAYRHDYEAVTVPLLYEEVDYLTAVSVIPKIVGFLLKSDSL